MQKGQRLRAGAVRPDHRAPPMPTGAPLRGREPHVGLLDALVAEVVDGASRVLLIRGEAGIGKTALLDHVTRHATGVATLRVTGVPSEQHLPLAGLLAVARPLADHVACLPPVQASSLGAAYAKLGVRSRTELGALLRAAHSR